MVFGERIIDVFVTHNKAKKIKIKNTAVNIFYKNNFVG